MTTKVCRKCRAEKPSTEFCVHPKHTKYCRACAAERMRTWVAKNPVRYKMAQHRYELKRKAARMAAKIARKAKRFIVPSPPRPPSTNPMTVASRRSRKKYPERYRARQLATEAIKAGTLIRQPCERCGDPKSHFHHPDYTKPLEGRWLCFAHHLEAHGGDFRKAS